MFELLINNWANFWLVLLGTLVLIYFYSTRNFDYWKKHNIDGPPAFPFVGTIFSFTKPIPYLHIECIKKYGKFFGGYRFSQPVLFISDPVVIKRMMVRDFHLFRNRVLTKPEDAFAQLYLVNARDEQWKRIRALLTPMFTGSRLKKMESLMRGCTEAMLSSFERLCNESGPEGIATLVVRDSMGNFTMDVIAKCAFATDTNAHVHNHADNLFMRHVHELTSFNLPRLLAGALTPNILARYLRKIKFPLLYSAADEFFINLSKHLVKERRSMKGTAAQQHEDMLQLMVNAEHSEKILDEGYEKEDLLEAHHVNVGTEELKYEKNLLKEIVGSKSLSENEIVAQSILFFMAGYETTASTLSCCLHELAVNPDIQERLYREIQAAKAIDPTLSYSTVQKLVQHRSCNGRKNGTELVYLDAVLSEALRKYPTLIQVSRECAADQYAIPELGHTLAKGDAVIFPIYGIHHCEEFYPQPERFNPDRFLPENCHQITPYTYLPFGGGPRNCIGMRFALSEAKLGIANLIDRFVLLRTDKTVDQLKIERCVLLLKTEPIYVGIKKRN